MRDQDRVNGSENHSAPEMRERRKVDRRLDSWKEIGAFFGRDERTVKRWEATRGLPVRRLPGKGRASVYAFEIELERWLEGTKALEAKSGATTEISEAVAVAPEFATVPVSEIPAEAAQPPESTQIDDFLPQPDFHVERTAVILPESPPLSPPRWTQRFSRVLLFAGLSLLAAALLVSAAYLLRSGSSRASQPAKTNTSNNDAQDLYLKGEYYLQKRTPESLHLALENYTQAIVLDPSYAQAYAGLADCYNLLREYTAMPDSEAYPRALAAAKHAIALDDSLSRAHSALAFVDFFWLLDAPDAQQEFERAIALDPLSVSAHHWYATCLLHLGRFQESLIQINRAQTLDPASTSVLSDKGLILFYAGHPDQSIALLKQVETAEPAFLSPRNYLAGIYLGTGNYRGFLDEASEGARLRHNQDRITILDAAETGFRNNGKKGLLEGMFVEQSRLYEAHRLSAFEMASSSARLGHQREALSYLHISISRHEPEIVSIVTDLGVLLLSHDPEYRKMIAQIGFPPPPE